MIVSEKVEKGQQSRNRDEQFQSLWTVSDAIFVLRLPNNRFWVFIVRSWSYSPYNHICILWNVEVLVEFINGDKFRSWLS